MGWFSPLSAFLIKLARIYFTQRDSQNFPQKACVGGFKFDMSFTYFLEKKAKLFQRMIIMSNLAPLFFPKSKSLIDRTLTDWATKANTGDGVDRMMCDSVTGKGNLPFRGAHTLVSPHQTENKRGEGRFQLSQPKLPGTGKEGRTKGKGLFFGNIWETAAVGGFSRTKANFSLEKET